MNKYASEPWRVSGQSMNDGSISIAEGRVIVAIVPNGISAMEIIAGREPEAQRDRAHLIAAAPVLYEFVLARAVAGDKDAVRVLQSFSKD